MKRCCFPFVAIIGQDKLKKALLLNVINPKIGGLLICGEKGTAKSTTVRAIGELLTDPKVVDLPLNITEDRLIGSIDMDKAIIYGKKELDYGLLKKANGNILYIDEVNLLNEHIVNTILSVASSGENHIERDGISLVHHSEFVLVGTMNPEEGSLRNVFLDKFGLYVEVKGTKDLSQRVEILKRRLEFEKDNIKFKKKYVQEEESLLKQIQNAKEIVKNINVKDKAIQLSAQFATNANCHGHRAELVIIETSKAIAALHGRKYINIEDLKEAAELALPHRMNEGTSPNNQYNGESHNCGQEHTMANNQESFYEDSNNYNDRKNLNPKKEEIQTTMNNSSNVGDSDPDENYNDQVYDIGNIFKVNDLNIKIINREERKGSGKRLKSKTSIREGRYVSYKQCNDKVKDIAFAPTIRVAAPYQRIRNNDAVAISIYKSDIKEKVREKRTGATILFVVDASSSMGVNKRMEAVKGAILSLLTDAYEKRDKIGLIAFRKHSAQVLLNITRSVDLALKELKYMATGGKTPLACGLEKAYEILEIKRKRDKDMIPLIVLISDGRANYHDCDKDPFQEAIKVCYKIREKDINSIVIDCEEGFVKFEMAKELSNALDGNYYKIDSLNSRNISNLVRKNLQ